MSDFYSVDPQGWEYDLQSVYSAYMGYFQLHCVTWHERSWAQFFESFEQFLAFSWPVVTVTDVRTGRAHIVTRLSSITAFVRMIKTRFGDTLPQVDNMLLVKPLETSQRHMRHVSEWSAYRKLYATLPAVALAAFKARVRAGDPAAVRELWAMRDKTFLALDFECSERISATGNNANNGTNGNSNGGHHQSSSAYVTITEWGYAVIRSNHLVAADAWPPIPDENYRKGHYVVSEHANTAPGGNVKAKLPPASVSWQYAFGDSQAISKAKLPCIIQSVLSSVLSPDSESVANNVVLIGHGVHAVLQRLEEMKIKLPSNVLILDIAYLERALYNAGERGPMVSRKTGAARMPESLLTLGGVLHALEIPLPSKGCALHNAGNDAFMTLVAFQRMVDPKGGVGVEGKADAMNIGTGERKSATRAGNKVERTNGDASTQGPGHVKRAATVAARFFRAGSGNKDIPEQQPQSQNQGLGGKGHVRAQSQMESRANAHGAADEMGIAVQPPNSRRVSMMSARTTVTTTTAVTAKTAGTAKASKPFIPRLRRAVETGTNEKRKDNDNEKNDRDNDNENEKASTSGSGSGSGSGTAGGIDNGNGLWWIPPLTMSPSISMSTSPPSSMRVPGGPGGHPYQRRHSAFVDLQRL